MDKLLGIALISIPFILAAYFAAKDIGVLQTFLIYVASIVLASMMLLGITLLLQ